MHGTCGVIFLPTHFILGGPPPKKKAKMDAGKTGNDGQASNRLPTATKARGKAKWKGAAGAAVGSGGDANPRGASD
jgi:hypothetical protein